MAAMKIALAGNPNCGKTTLFNELTGSNQYVGNWPGVTVEKKDGQLKGHKDVIIQDLPGIYSLSPYTLEEVVTRRYLVNEKPDAIINIIDGTNLERNLYLTTQILELNLPMVVAINMMDLVAKNGDKIDLAKLASLLGCEVIPISASNGDGCHEIVEAAMAAAATHRRAECPHVFSGSVEHALAHIEESLDERVDRKNLRWFAVKIFERDEKMLEELRLPDDLRAHLEEHIVDCEKEMDDDSESIIVNQRYDYIGRVISQTLKRKAAPGSLTLSDKIDRIATNRVLALPLFALVIWFMYWVSVSTIGTWMTDWANDGVFGDGWFLAWTADSGWFTSKEVKERNALAEKSFDAKAALAARNEEIASANAATRKAWELSCAKAWAAGQELPPEPDYEPPAAAVAFEPETWASVSRAYQEARLRASRFEEVYLEAVQNGEAMGFHADQAANAAAELVAQAVGRCEAAEDKELAKRYFTLLTEDATDKAAFAADLKFSVSRLPPPPDDGLDDGRDGDELAYPEIAELLKVPVHFEDAESGEIKRTELVDYDAYLANAAAASADNAPDPAKYGVWVPGVPGLVESFLDKLGANAFVKSLVLDGIIGGVGTVFGFLPQIMIVFLFLAFLEDCGYMSRIAFIMDRILRRFGLSGKSFIPMLIGSGCGVPAILASRTIENQNDRRMTIILAPFVPCGAKLTIVAMMVGAFFPGSNLIGPSMYFIGIAIIVIGGIALKKTRAFAGEISPFVMELPAYHMPSLKNVWIHTWERGKGYAVKAGTIIFAACIVLWLLMHLDWKFHLLDPSVAGDLECCLLHDIGQCIAWIFRPLGFGNWQGAVACASAEIAKEQATATLALVSPNVGGGTLKGIQALFHSMVPATIADPAQRLAYSKLIAFSFMVCNLFFPPCLAAIATSWREMGTAKWGAFAVIFQLFVGYGIALVSFRLGILIWGGASFGLGQVVALALIAFVLFAVLRPGTAKQTKLPAKEKP